MTRKFLAQSLNAIFQSAACYTPIFYTAAYSKTLGYRDSKGSNLTALTNAYNAMGNVGVSLIVDKFGRLDSFFLTTILSSIIRNHPNSLGLNRFILQSLVIAGLKSSSRSR